MTKEEIYDNEIRSLVAQIITICKTHEIAYIMDFGLGNAGLRCTSINVQSETEPSPDMLAAWRILRPRS